MKHVMTTNVSNSLIVWGLWFLLFLVLEFLGLFHVTPWNSLSDTAWDLENVSDWIKVLFLAGLIILTVHIVFRWP